MIPRPPLNYPETNLATYLEHSVTLRPDSLAVVCDGQSVSYRELDGLVNACTKALLAEGIGPRDRVVLSMGNRIEWVVVMFAILRAGAAIVATNPRWSTTELRHAVELTSPRLVIADATSREATGGTGVPMLTVEDGFAGTLWERISNQDGVAPPTAELDWRSDEAVLFFSSGTTGMPKAVRHSHFSFGAAMITWKSAVRINGTDRQQYVLPLFTVMGISTVIGSVAAGAPLFLAKGFVLEEMLSEIQREHITVSTLVAPIAKRLADHPGLDEADLRSLRYLVWAATAANPAVATTVTERTGVRWLLGYGMTELPGMHCNPAEYPARCRIDSPGVPRSDAEIRVVDPDTLADVPEGEVGELVARSPAMMLGYLPSSADEDAFLSGGWLRSGDLGHVDAEGWLTLTDRSKDMIKVSGLQMAPTEVEALLMSHHAIADCAVVGEKDPDRGEVPVAFVVAGTAQRPSDVEITGWLAGLLSSYKVPRRLVWTDDIPRTASGKTLRRALRDRLSEPLAGTAQET